MYLSSLIQLFEFKSACHAMIIVLIHFRQAEIGTWIARHIRAHFER